MEFICISRWCVSYLHVHMSIVSELYTGHSFCMHIWCGRVMSDLLQQLTALPISQWCPEMFTVWIFQVTSFLFSSKFTFLKCFVTTLLGIIIDTYKLPILCKEENETEHPSLQILEILDILGLNVFLSWVFWGRDNLKGSTVGPFHEPLLVFLIVFLLENEQSFFIVPGQQLN